VYLAEALSADIPVYSLQSRASRHPDCEATVAAFAFESAVSAKGSGPNGRPVLF
jgi:hypothetical protein